MQDSAPSYGEPFDVARVALGRGDGLGAEQSLRAAITAAEQRPESRQELSAALISLGELKRDESSYAEAEELFRRALEVGEGALGPDDISTVPALTGLAAIRIARGAPHEAVPLLTRALTISEHRLGHDHPDLVVLLNELSRLHLKQSAPASAEPLLLRLFAIKRAKGEEHPEVATVLASLAAVRQALGRHDAAEQLWRRVLSIRERTLAPNHFALATATEHLAETCAARGKLDEALRLFQRSLVMREVTLGASHASLRILRERIADVQLQASEEPLVGESPATPTIAPDWRLVVSSAALQTPGDAPDPDRHGARTAHAAPPEPWRYTPLVEQRPSSAVIMPAFVGDFAPHPDASPFDGAPLAYEGARHVLASWVTRFRHRPTPLITATAGAIVLFLLTAGAVSHARSRTEQVTSSDPLSAQQGEVVVPPVLRDSLPRSRGTVSGSLDRAREGGTAPSTRPPARSPRFPAELTPASRSTASTEPSAGPPSRPLPPGPIPTVGDLSRAVPGAMGAHLDSVMRAASRSVSSDAIRAGASLTARDWVPITAIAAADSEGMTQPARLIGALPRAPYPEALRAKGAEGKVVVEFWVDTSGRPDMATLTVLESDHELFTTSVRKVIPYTRFVPGQDKGEKIPSRVRIPFAFALTRD
jgi:TonB family protein